MSIAIYDLDIGQDVDDTFVVWILAREAVRSLPALVVTNDETPALGRARFLRKVLREAGAPPIPLAAGLPSARRRASSLVEEAGLVGPADPAPSADAVERIIRVLNAHDSVEYFGLGALTNLDAALARAPELAGRLKLTQMGPAMASSYLRATPQYNARLDPAAFSRVLHTVPTPTLVTSATTWARRDDGSGRLELGVYPDEPFGRAILARRDLLASHFDAWLRSGKECTILHDPLTMFARRLSIVTFAAATIELGDDGTADFHPGGRLHAEVSLAADYRAARAAIGNAIGIPWTIGATSPTGR